MNPRRLVFALLLSSLAFAARAQSDVETQIRVLEDRIAQAWIDGDAEFLDGVFDPRYVHTNTLGIVTNRYFDLDEVRRRDPRFDTYRHADVRVFVHGDSAIASGRTSVAGHFGETPFALELRFTDTFVKVADTWLLVATHVTPLRAARAEAGVGG